MIDIETFRSRIGRFNQIFRCKRSSFIKKVDRKHQPKFRYQAFRFLQILTQFYFLAVFLIKFELYSPHCELSPHQTVEYGDGLLHSQAGTLLHDEKAHGAADRLVREKLAPWTGQRKVTVNFQARYKHGNRQNLKGIKNFHQNIRSLSNKVSEIKNIIREHQPHILGISECELKKCGNSFDESKLKVPGYDLIFPKSWAVYGHVRVVIYIKKTLEYEQVLDLESDDVQSVWVKTGFSKSKKLYFCHTYREHMNSMGGSLRDQRIILEKFLSQWEEALVHGNIEEENEVHISGDMNLDALNNRWHDPSYHLVTLSNLVQTACYSLDFSQLVSLPTRSQYNSNLLYRPYLHQQKV